MTSVLAAPLFDPGSGRVHLDLPEGLTVAQIVARALPVTAPADRDQLRVALVTAGGSTLIEPALWHAIRPRPGVQVMIRVIPAGDTVRSILSIVITVAAVAMGNLWGAKFGQLIGVSEATGKALVTLGANVLGSLALRALIPPAKPEEQRKSYSIQGWRNRLEPDGAVPVVLGTQRYAPPFAVMSYTEIVGDWQYVRAAFTCGYGPVQISDVWLGETPLSEFDEVEIETREGRVGDAPLSLISHQVIEDAIGVELTRPLPRDDLGEVIKGEPGKETPVVRVSAADATGASVIFAFPAGLTEFDKKGKKRSRRVQVRVRQRLAGVEAWTTVQTLTLIGKRSEAFYRQHSWQFPARGRWEIELTRLTDETDNSQISDRVVWGAFQSIRPEYPLAFTSPLALIALRIKATHQLNGQLDNLSALLRKPCLDYDSASGLWVERVTSNPAALYRYILTSPANPRPVTTAQLDLDQIEAWHDYCRINGLTYDRVLEEAGTTLRDVLAEIAAAGRASPWHDGMRWGVVIDDTRSKLIVDHISPRNSWGFRTTRSYVQPPHGFRCKFTDRTADYKPAERLVSWPGHEGEITLTEALDMPGKTDPAEVWREARRRMYEAIYRPDSYEVFQSGSVRVATRGDLVALSHDVLDDVQIAVRVRSVRGTVIEIDEDVMMTEGVAYGIRFRPEIWSDPIPRSVVLPLTTVPGAGRLLHLATTPGADVPAEGDMVLFGRRGEESRTLLVTGVEATEDGASLLRLIDAAPEIDERLEADVVPPWSGRAGADLPILMAPLPVPRIVGVESGLSGAGAVGELRVQVAPGSGPVATASYTLRHRLLGAEAWTSVSISSAEGAMTVTAYGNGSTVEITAVAVSAAGVESDSCPIVQVVIGAGDAPSPAEILATSIVATPLLGGATVTFETPADPAMVEVQIYCAPVLTLDKAAHAAGAPIAVSPSREVKTTIGDGTRKSLVVNGDFAAATGWTLGGGWSVSGGVAARTVASASSISQAITLAAGATYRVAATLTRTAGSLTAQLQGGSAVSGATRTTSGRARDRLVRTSGNSAVGWLASADFVGSIDDLVVFQETATCLPQGVNYLWLESRNADGLAGPITGPIAFSVD